MLSEILVGWPQTFSDLPISRCLSCHVGVQLNAIEARTVDGLGIGWYHCCCIYGHLMLGVKPAYCSLATEL